MDTQTDKLYPYEDIFEEKEGDGEETEFTLGDRIALKELRDNYQKAIEDRDKKLESAKDQLVEMLHVTVDKYRTATGTAEALRMLRFTSGEECVDLSWANNLAWKMSHEAERMHAKAQGLGYAEMDKLCEGFYDEEFYVGAEHDSDEHNPFYKLALELMRIDLCRNVGPAADDMLSFMDRADTEIANMRTKIEELEEKERKSKEEK